MKPRKDIITEEEYNRRMTPPSSSPEHDSPGDSEEDAGVEFQMGLDYTPKDLEDEDIEELAVAAEVEEQLEPAPQAKIIRKLDDLPESAKVISSEQPSPWMDLEGPSDTH